MTRKPAAAEVSAAASDVDVGTPVAMLSVLRFVTSYWGRRAGLFVTGVCASLLGTAFDLALPWASAALVDDIAAGRSS
ncbi:hypothetical protein OFC53_36310, partial [Escherichia coli]|nr:hypothetical protein [Escherichia coli]